MSLHAAGDCEVQIDIILDAGLQTTVAADLNVRWRFADKVEQYKGGKEALFGFFVGQTMKAMQGKANPQVVNELLKKALG